MKKSGSEERNRDDFLAAKPLGDPSAKQLGPDVADEEAAHHHCLGRLLPHERPVQVLTKRETKIESRNLRHELG